MTAPKKPTDTQLLDWLQLLPVLSNDGDEELTGWVCNIYPDGDVEILRDSGTRDTVREAIAAAMEAKE